MVHRGDLAPGLRTLMAPLAAAALATAQPMKCLVVINDLARAGAEKQATLLACGLKALGWSISVVVIKQRNDFAEPLAAAEIPVTSLGRRGPFDLGVVPRLRNAIREASPDVVISFLFLANLLTVLASRSMSRRPAIVLSVRASYRFTLTRPQRLVARVAHRGADLTLFNSTSALREEEAGCPKVGQVGYLPNAVSTTSTKAVDWSAVGVDAERVVLSVGQFETVKGHHVLIEAFATVREASPTARLVLVGQGPQEGRLRALALARGLSEHVTFLGHRPDPLPFMAGADVFVQPSLSEGMSNALMEAMSLGRCIVATRVGAAVDLIDDGIEALLTPPNARDLALAIVRALADPALRARLGEAAQKRAEDFSADRIVSRLDTILRGVVEERESWSRSRAQDGRS